MASRLKDPFSARYNFGQPQKGVSQDGWARGGKKHFGWIVPVSINAKNSYGGYTGDKQYYFFLSDGQIGDITAMYGSGMAKIIDK